MKKILYRFWIRVCPHHIRKRTLASFPQWVYPNPASSVVKVVNHNKAHSTVEMVLTNMVGEVVLSQKRCFSTYLIDIEQLSSGFYFLTLKKGEEILTPKIAKR